MPVTVIVDAFWGDSGKGKACAHLATTLDASLAVRAGVGTNAGASFTLPDGTHVKQRQLPTAWVNPKTQLAVGPGVLVHPDTLLSEMERYGLQDRTTIDHRCGVITAEDIEADQQDQFLRDVVGTSGSGVGPARARYVNRTASQARDHASLAHLSTDVAVEANRRAAAGEEVLIEGAQGTQLSVSFSYEYPCTTVKNCTTAAAIDDVGLNWRHLSDVLLVVKAMPTRVGQGPLPHEMTHAEAEARGIAEYGVNTGRPRRKAHRIDDDLLAYAAMLNGPTKIALTFTDHYDPAMRGRTDPAHITPRVRDLITHVEEVTGAPVTMIDTGPLLSHIIDLDR
ncbi:adenylosuccinate synthetase [Desertihabitans aurantiacus]|uniref:adenylosuccinate synthetase n=1 Tax=Desertihabitans aurantiacus TaxID=2282477 RepID=UPI000DF7A368|nr:adenylosuccinate synthetase [Desertihabitans aurantiacus]